LVRSFKDMGFKEDYLGIRIDFQSKRISDHLVVKGHPLYQWQETILSFLNDWKNESKSILKVSTSGTTGIPKRIFFKKEYMYECAKRTAYLLNITSSGIKGLLCLHPESIASKMFLIRAIIFRWNIYCIPPSSNPLRNIKGYFDIVSMVPIQVYYSLKNLERIRILLIGGAPISKYLEKKLQNISTICYSTYGMTETLGHIALKKINGLDKTDYYESLKDVSIGIDNRNCLRIFYPYCMDTLIQTNDIVHLISENRFNWIGRFDHVINSGGIKIIPELVEKEIFPFIPHRRRFFVSSIPDTILGERIILIIEGPTFTVRIPKSIFIEKKRFYKPKNVFFVEHFIENYLGKLKIKEIINRIIVNNIKKYSIIYFSIFGFFFKI